MTCSVSHDVDLDRACDGGTHPAGCSTELRRPEGVRGRGWPTGGSFHERRHPKFAWQRVPCASTSSRPAPDRVESLALTESDRRPNREASRSAGNSSTDGLTPRRWSQIAQHGCPRHPLVQRGAALACCVRTLPVHIREQRNLLDRQAILAVSAWRALSCRTPRAGSRTDGSRCRRPLAESK
jgi:hypothetical protein